MGEEASEEKIGEGEVPVVEEIRARKEPVQGEEVVEGDVRKEEVGLDD